MQQFSYLGWPSAFVRNRSFKRLVNKNGGKGQHFKTKTMTVQNLLRYISFKMP